MMTVIRYYKFDIIKHKNSWKILKEQSDAVNGRTDNEMAKEQTITEKQYTVN